MSTTHAFIIQDNADRAEALDLAVASVIPPNTKNHFPLIVTPNQRLSAKYILQPCNNPQEELLATEALHSSGMYAISHIAPSGNKQENPTS
jgi:hypothetical protein